MISLGNRELWHSGIELQLQALQQNRVVNVSLSPPPAQYAVSQNQFHALGLALDSPIESVQRLKYLHRRASWPLALRPLIARELPTLQRHSSCLVVFKPRNARASRRIRFSLAFPKNNLLQRIVPPGLQPIGNVIGWLGRARQYRALDLQQEIPNSITLGGLSFLGLGLWGTGFCRSAFNTRMAPPGMNPTAPWPRADLASRRVS